MTVSIKLSQNNLVANILVCGRFGFDNFDSFEAAYPQSNRKTKLFTVDFSECYEVTCVGLAFLMTFKDYVDLACGNMYLVKSKSKKVNRLLEQVNCHRIFDLPPY